MTSGPHCFCYFTVCMKKLAKRARRRATPRSSPLFVDFCFLFTFAFRGGELSSQALVPPRPSSPSAPSSVAYPDVCHLFVRLCSFVRVRVRVGAGVRTVFLPGRWARERASGVGEQRCALWTRPSAEQSSISPAARTPTSSCNSRGDDIFQQHNILFFLSLFLFPRRVVRVRVFQESV